jgi:hypothetical protein
MSTSNFFKSIVTVALGAVISMGAFAQVTTSGTIVANGVTKGTPHAYTAPTAAIPNVVDFVTKGSTMPYSVTPDPVIATVVASGAPFQASSYNWRFGTTPLGTFSPALTINAGDLPPYNAGWYQESNISVNWTTVGKDSLKVSEHSRNSAGLPTCTGADSTLYVYVMPVPSAAFNLAKIGNVAAGDLNGSVPGTIGGCSTDGKIIHFAVNVTGTQDFIANGRYQYTPFGGAAGSWISTTVGLATFVNDSVVSTGIKNGTGGTFDGAATNFYTALPATPNSTTIDAFQFTIPTGVYGKYVFQLYRVTDLVSRKSFKDTDGIVANGYDNVANEGSLGAQEITVYSLPTPTTGKIQHITNLGW